MGKGSNRKAIPELLTSDDHVIINESAGSKQGFGSQ